MIVAQTYHMQKQHKIQKSFKIVISCIHHQTSKSTFRTKKCRIEVRVLGYGAVANGRKFFPEREYVHSGQAWLWSFPTISKKCRAGPGESVMAEHRATKQKVYTF